LTTNGAAVSLALDGAGNLFFVEYPNRIHKTSPNGTITTWQAMSDQPRTRISL